MAYTAPSITVAGTLAGVTLNINKYEGSVPDGIILHLNGTKIPLSNNS